MNFNFGKTFRVAAVLAASAFAIGSAQATTITIGNSTSSSLGNVDTCVSCNYIINQAAGVNGYTVTTFSVNAFQSGDITPVLYTRTNAGGTATFTVVGVGTSQTVSGAGLATFSFGLTAGTDITTADTYFGWYSNSPIVSFDYFDASNPPGNANGGNFFVVPGSTMVGSSSTDSYGTYFNSQLGVQNNRLYAANMTAVSPSVGITPEPSSFALLGTGVLGIAGFARRRFQK